MVVLAALCLWLEACVHAEIPGLVTVPGKTAWLVLPAGGSTTLTLYAFDLRRLSEPITAVQNGGGLAIACGIVLASQRGTVLVPPAE